jgi:hypothetical protein
MTGTNDKEKKRTEFKKKQILKHTNITHHTQSEASKDGINTSNAQGKT